MEYSAIGPGQEISAEGVGYDKGSVKEGATRMRIGHGAKVMVNIHNLILTLIRQARRFFADHLSEAFSLLVTPFS